MFFHLRNCGGKPPQPTIMKGENNGNCKKGSCEKSSGKKGSSEKGSG